MDKKPVLLITVGLPRSYKSTWSRAQRVPVVTPDAVRAALHNERFIPEAEPAVWMIVRYMIKALFIAGHESVILDSTNTTRVRREKWRNEFWDCHFVVFQDDKETCIARAAKLGDTGIIPIIERMAAEFEPVTPEEGKSFTPRI